MVAEMRFYPGAGKGGQHPAACGILSGIDQDGVLAAGQQQALRLTHIKDPEGQPCGGRVGGGAFSHGESSCQRRKAARASSRKKAHQSRLRSRRVVY